ncbi:MAG: glycoside hydrolase family 43 protein, partial [Pseudomonadota bacterium]|nr:glycoside hydrolase family 43 protein [Pseudomonadota bacterium]
PGRSGAGLPVERLGAEAPHLILNENFPDPFVASFDGRYHAYATGNQVGGGQMNVQLVTSANLTQWSAPVEAFPAANLPSWVDRSHPQVWAPEVMPVAGRYVLYFNARHATLTRTETPPEGPRVLQRHCLGAAVAERPEGPFVGIGEPLVCAEFANGVIDASPFRDGDSLYVYYKDDSNCCAPGSAIYAQGLSPDGLAALGPAHRLVANNDSPEEHDDWEWRVVEAPTMVRRGDTYFLFYSGNFFGNKNYSVAYLRCATPRGPCTDPGENPILYSHDASPLVGPGHQALLDIAGRSYVFFHGWNADPDARERPGFHKRCLYVSRVHWERTAGGEERPRIVGGTPPGRR